jgi:hypothetical protein
VLTHALDAVGLRAAVAAEQTVSPSSMSMTTPA